MQRTVAIPIWKGESGLFRRLAVRVWVCLGVALLLMVRWAEAGAEDSERLRAEQVGWARLRTPSTLWMRHSGSDPVLMRFFRDSTTLNIDPTWYAADIGKLDEMCAYPFLFAQSLDLVVDPQSFANLGEYIRRGGFLLVDGCINPHMRGSCDAFIHRQAQEFRRALPDAVFAVLPSDHDIYRCFFRFDGGPPHTEDHEGWGIRGLVGIYLGDRLVGIVSTSGLQCGWDGMKRIAGHEQRSMEMLVNIYIYAMMQGR